jgi:uncharacterized protein YjbJ (UPF0337 family)
MPAWVNTKEEKRAWKKAKGIVSEQRGKSEDDFEDRDWGLVTHIAKNILSSSVLSASTNNGLIYRLAKVDHILKVRAKKADVDAHLPDDSKVLVEALKQLMSMGGQTIAALRKAESSGMEMNDAEDLAAEIEDVAGKIKDLLEEVR